MKVADIIAEGIDIHGLASSKEERIKRVHDLLETVGLNKEHAGRYPHEFSGGQRQRIGIASLCLSRSSRDVPPPGAGRPKGASQGRQNV
jgi:ABC-type microcin C transport system duplicated ATPase subunit YejF